MQLDALEDEWEADSHIDITDLLVESAEVPKLHAKWLKRWNKAKLGLRKYESAYWQTYTLRARYYKGELSKTELDANGWRQYQFPKPIKADLEVLLNADPEVRVAADRMEYYKVVVQFLDQVMKSINSRTWDCKNTIEVAKLHAGL